jgi:hypothetical protein
VQKYMGDAIRQALKSGLSPRGSLVVAQPVDCLVIQP